MDPIYTSGIQIILFFQHLGAWLAIPMQMLSFLGSTAFFLLVAPVIYWCLDSATGLRVALALMFSQVVNDALKTPFHSPRPYWIDTQVEALGSEISFGMPSGHAQTSVVVWGTLAYSVHRRWAWYLAIALVCLVGLSRIYLAVHFPTDVLAGWLVGLLVLVIFIRLERPVIGWVKTLTVVQQSLLFLAVSLAFILVGWGSRAAISNWQLPAVWVENAHAARPEAAPINPLDLTNVITTAGAFLGLTLGGAWVYRRGGFEMRRPVWQLAVRFLIGVTGVLVIWIGLGSLLPDDVTILAFIFRYLRYSLIGFWITALAPAIFVRLSLSRWNTDDKD